MLAVGTIFSIIVKGGAAVGGLGKPVRSEINGVFPSQAELGNQRVVSVEHQLGFGTDAFLDGVGYPFRMAVPGQLVPLKVGDDVMGRREIPEGIFAEPLVAFN